MTNHPIEEYEQAYAAEAQERYQRLEDDVEDRIDDTDSDIGTSAFGAAVAGYVASRARQHGLKPSGDDTEWFDPYVRQSYADGREFAQGMLEQQGYSASSHSLSNNPYHRKGLEKAHQRQRKYWGSLVTDLREEVRSELGSVDSGATLQQARSAAVERIQNTGMDRARRIANYEPNWAFSKAQISEYRAADVSNVRVDIRWETMGDSRVCPQCQSNEGTYTISAAENMLELEELPAHPFCRCILVPE